MRRFLLLAAVTAALVIPASSAAADACYEIKIPNRPTLLICV